MKIELISNLMLSEVGLISSNNNNYTVENRLIPIRQGDLDGACGIYSLMMAIMTTGALTRSQVLQLWEITPDYRTVFGQAIKKYGALAQNGLTENDLLNLFKSIKYHPTFINNPNLKRLNAATLATATKSQNAMTAIVQAVDNDKPSIVRLDWGGGYAHWVTAIGYQTFQNTTTEYILVLDPGASSDTTSAWNGILSFTPNSTGHHKYRYWGKSIPATDCTVSMGLIFS